MMNDVEHLVQNKDYIDRYIMVIKILYEAKKCKYCMITYHRARKVVKSDRAFRKFVSAERKMHVFASIIMHIEAMKRVATMGWPWDSTLERLQGEFQKLCSVYGIPANNQCEYSPQLKPLEALILSNVKTGACGTLTHYFPRATRESGKAPACPNP